MSIDEKENNDLASQTLYTQRLVGPLLPVSAFVVSGEPPGDADLQTTFFVQCFRSQEKRGLDHSLLTSKKSQIGNRLLRNANNPNILDAVTD